MDETDIFMIVLGLVLALGTAFVYVVQIVPIAVRRRADGISEWMVSINAVACAMVLANLTIVHPRAANGIVPYLQAFVCLPMSWGLLATIGIVRPSRHWTVVTVFCVSVCSAVLVTVGGFSLAAPELMFDLGVWIGVAAAGFTAVTWLPQIAALLRTKAVGQLSFLFIMFEFVGSVIVLAYQAYQFGLAQGWSSWLAGLVQAAELAVLLVLYVFTYARSRLSVPDEPGARKEDVIYIKGSSGEDGFQMDELIESEQTPESPRLRKPDHQAQV
jgi:uncharacterized protein with PQ loop repeat